ncbi:MAG: hypothetical protein U0S50_12675 [Sphingopyxis sp.]|uniref:hypothetical protein n=1 Tax=Sphingopyxis sp. TaxID=1908224 RepID=UPI002ABA25B7|nr:hypothetical protein [Sphingopyxis sp.]MDZ3832651.1 hypothetical protein [Sphingopyxis sp.]
MKDARPNPQPPIMPVHDGMRRLQIGIAGVLTVLLLVGMAGVIGDRARERATEDAAAASQVKMPGEEGKSASAPLEELGVQPVSKDENAATTVKVPQTAPVPAPATVPDLEPDPELERARQSKKE